MPIKVTRRNEVVQRDEDRLIEPAGFWRSKHERLRVGAENAESAVYLVTLRHAQLFQQAERFSRRVGASPQYRLIRIKTGHRIDSSQGSENQGIALNRNSTVANGVTINCFSSGRVSRLPRSPTSRTGSSPAIVTVRHLAQTNVFRFHAGQSES